MHQAFPLHHPFHYGRKEIQTPATKPALLEVFIYQQLVRGSFRHGNDKPSRPEPASGLPQPPAEKVFAPRTRRRITSTRGTWSLFHCG